MDNSVEIINRLRKEQLIRENTINNISDPGGRFLSAIRTLALYNCAKAIELTADYLRGWETTKLGRGISSLGVKDTVDRFTSNAREILSGFDPILRKQAEQLGQACHAMIDSSVFSITLPRRVQQLILELSNPQNPSPT